MSLDKFTAEAVDELIFDAIEAVRGRFHKRPDESSICKYLNVSAETEKLYIENRIDVVHESNKIRNKEFQGSDSYFINYNKNLNSHEFTNGTKKKKKNFMAPFCGWGSTASRLEPLRGGSLLFTTKFPVIPGTHFIDLGRMKG